MNRHRSRLAFVFFLLLSSCKGCHTSDAGSLVDLAAPDARAVVSIPNLASTLRGVGQFATNATKRAGKEALDGARKSFADQLGFDPFTPTGFSTSGIDPSRGLVLFTEGDREQGVLGVHVSDKSKFETWLKSLLQRNSGASKVEERTQDGVSYFVASRPFGTESAPSLYWQFIRNDVLMAGPDAMESFVAAVKRNSVRVSGAAVSQTPLSADPTYLALNQKIPQGDIKVFARGKDVDGKKSGSIAGSFAITATGVNVDAFVDFPVAGLAEALDGEPPLALASRVEDDAVIVMLTRAAKPEGLKALRSSPLTAEAVDRMLSGFTRATQLDAEKELVPLLKGPITLGVHVMDLTSLPSALARRVSTSAMLDYVHVSLTAEVTSHEQMLAVLDKSQGLVEQAGNKVTKRTATVAGKQATIYEPDGATIGWGVVDDLYVYGAGKGRIERAIEQAVAAKEDKSVAPKLTGTVATALGKQRGSVLLVARASALADNIARLSGSDDTMIKAVMPMVSQAIEVLRTVGDVAIAAKVEKEGVRIEARETLR